MDRQSYAIPETDGYIAYGDGQMMRPIGAAFVNVPKRKIGKYWYCHVKLGGKYRTVRLHRILCSAFNGPPDSPRLVARHLDDNKDNNCIGNLSWGTVKDNAQDSIRNGTFAYSVSGTGENHLHAKLTDCDVKNIRLLLLSGVRGCDLADKYKVCRATITLIKKRKIWTHI